MILLTVPGAEIPVHQLADGSLTFLAGAMIDDDGSGDPHNDPDFQARTSYRNGGRWLNADKDRYIVLPPEVILAVKPMVLGCRARVTNVKSGLSWYFIVGDVGPHEKIGEMSMSGAKALGIPDSPTSGGTTDAICVYEVWPGLPATLNGFTYALQSYSLAA
jgi:hypothetical protein